MNYSFAQTQPTQVGQPPPLMAMTYRSRYSPALQEQGVGQTGGASPVTVLLLGGLLGAAAWYFFVGDGKKLLAAPERQWYAVAYEHGRRLPKEVEGPFDSKQEAATAGRALKKSDPEFDKATAVHATDKRVWDVPRGQSR